MHMATPNILITGGTGFLGSAIVRALAEKHPAWSLTVFDARTPKPAEDAIAGVTYLQADITIASDVDAILARVKPSVVIHTAGFVRSLI